jgi:hypothetical protein
MKLKTLVLEGPLTSTLKYRLASVEPITQGSWQIAISSVSFVFQKAADLIVDIETNFVQQRRLLNTGVIFSGPAKLHVLHCSGKANTSQTVLLPTRDWFDVTNADNFFEINIAHAMAGHALPATVHVTVLVLLRRVK